MCMRPAAAQDAFAGTWAVTDAQPAPWIDGSAVVQEVGPDYLFEGGLTDPVKQAAALGFTSQKIVSLSMGCVSNDADIEMDFDLIDHDTAVFALNNVIYKMVRAPAP